MQGSGTSAIVTHMEVSDQELILHAKADSRRFAALYEKYALTIYNYFWFRLHQKDERTEDLTQETFLHAFEHLHTYRLQGYTYRTYLLTIAHNILVNEYRQKKTLSLDALDDPEGIPETIIEDGSDKERLDAVWKAIQELPLLEKDIMLLRYRKELSVKEIAHVVRKTENAVKLILSRTQRKLQHHKAVEAIAAFRAQEKQLRTPRFRRT